MRLQPHPDPWNTGAEMNRHWRRQQEKAQAKQNANTDVHHDVVKAKPTPVIHTDTPVNLPVDSIFTSAITDTGNNRFVSFLSVYKKQTKTGQVKPITVKKHGDVYILIDGSRRLAAARMLKMPTIAAIVQEV